MLPVEKFQLKNMMASSNGNIFRVTGPLWGESIGDRWIPLTNASDADLWCFFDLPLNKRSSKNPRCRWFEMSSNSSWRRCNVFFQNLKIQSCFNRNNAPQNMFEQHFIDNSCMLQYKPDFVLIELIKNHTVPTTTDNGEIWLSRRQ